MLDTTLLVLTSDGYQTLDIFQEIPISVNYSELSITEIDSRTSPYSSTFTIPGTEGNNVIFEHFYEINGTDFNPLNELACVVQYRGNDIFRGKLRLNKVTLFYDYSEYEVYITSELTSLASALKETTLIDLDWADYYFDMVYSSITTSWSANTQDNRGLFNGDIVMPMINYGLPIQSGQTAPDWFFSMDNDVQYGSITYSGNAINPLYFKPAIRIKAVVDKIFSNIGYNYNSDFFETDYFRSIYMDTAQNGQIGPVLGSGVTNENFFKVFSPSPFTLLPRDAQGNQKLQWSFPFNNLGNAGYDPLQQVTFWNAANPEQTGYFQVPYSGDYYWNLRFTYAQKYLYSQDTIFRLRVKVADNVADLENGGTILYQTPGAGLAADSGNKAANIFFSGTVQAGQYVKPYLVFESGAIAAGLYIQPFQGITILDDAPMWELYGSPFITSATTIDMKLQMPDITCMNFMRGLINQFNLVITQDVEQNTFNIEPLPWYFDEDQRTERDWTDYLDINSPVEIAPLNFDLPKQINLKGFYNENETLNRQYLSDYQLLFGEKRFITDTTIPDGELTIETIFSPLPTDFISGSTNVIIPQLWYLEKDQEPIGAGNYPIPRQNSPHLFFWLGNRYFWKDWGDYSTGNQRRWWLLSGNTPIAQTTYPCVSHVSSLDTLNAAVVSELNFYPSTDYYFAETTDFTKYVQNTTYRYFWQTHIENLYSGNARKLTGRFVMSPQYYADLKLTDKIYIKDAAFRIDRITNANLVEPALTEITLVKDLNLFYRETLWAPPTGIAPNAPYPSEPGCVVYAFTAVANYDPFLVCTRDTPLVTLYSSDPAGLVEGARIYTTNTCSTFADTGLYLRLTGSTENFVIDFLGTALSNGQC